MILHFSLLPSPSSFKTSVKKKKLTFKGSFNSVRLACPLCPVDKNGSPPKGAEFRVRMEAGRCEDALSRSGGPIQHVGLGPQDRGFHVNT